MFSRSEAYTRGRAAGERARAGYPMARLMRETFEQTHQTYPAAAHLDLAAELVRLDRERMANPPDLVKYPETRGLPDLVREERRGFADGYGAGELELAYHFTWTFFYSRRILTRYVGTAPAAGECSAAYIAESREGGPLYGRNWDVTPTAWAQSLLEPPRQSPDETDKLVAKGVSCNLFLDEEPSEIFPVNPWALMPPECRTVDDAVEFLSRYREFWGPGNTILWDAGRGSVAIEKANVRMGVRRSTRGASAVGACCFLIPEMKAFKEEKDRLSIARRGWTIEEAPDWTYWQGANQRYRRLLDLTDAAARGNPDLFDMAAIMTDHAVPYPARVCLAGQSCIPGVTPEQAEWTMCSHSEVLTGANRRMLFYVAEDGKACYETPPYLVLGCGVCGRPEWEEQTRPLPPVARNPRPLIHEEYAAVRVML
jgi:hypothetical protein